MRLENLFLSDFAGVCRIAFVYYHFMTCYVMILHILRAISNSKYWHLKHARITIIVFSALSNQDFAKPHMLSAKVYSPKI